MLMLLVAVTTWAQTSYETSTAENPQWYTIGSYNRGGYLTNVGIGNGVQHVVETLPVGILLAAGCAAPLLCGAVQHPQKAVRVVLPLTSSGHVIVFHS